MAPFLIASCLLGKEMEVSQMEEAQRLMGWLSDHWPQFLSHFVSLSLEYSTRWKRFSWQLHQCHILHPSHLIFCYVYPLKWSVKWCWKVVSDLKCEAFNIILKNKENQYTFLLTTSKIQWSLLDPSDEKVLWVWSKDPLDLVQISKLSHKSTMNNSFSLITRLSIQLLCI